MASKSAKLLQLINYRESRSLCNFLGDGVLGGPSPGAARTDPPCWPAITLGTLGDCSPAASLLVCCAGMRVTVTDGRQVVGR